VVGSRVVGLPVMVIVGDFETGVPVTGVLVLVVGVRVLRVGEALTGVLVDAVGRTVGRRDGDAVLTVGVCVTGVLVATVGDARGDLVFKVGVLVFRVGVPVFAVGDLVVVVGDEVGVPLNFMVTPAEPTAITELPCATTPYHSSWALGALTSSKSF
jgi:hypothetical protein